MKPLLRFFGLTALLSSNLSQSYSLKKTEEENDFIQAAPEFTTISKSPSKHAIELRDQAYQAWYSNSLTSTKKALKFINKAIDLDPEGLWLHFDQGSFLFSIKDYEAAIESFSKEIEIDNFIYPRSRDRSIKHSCLSFKSESYLKRAQSFSYLGHNKEALSDYQEVIAIAEDVPYKDLKSMARTARYNSFEITYGNPFTIASRAMIVTLLGMVALITNNIHKRTTKDFRDENEAEKAVKYFARSTVDMEKEIADLSLEEKKSLIKLATQEVKKDVETLCKIKIEKTTTDEDITTLVDDFFTAKLQHNNQTQIQEYDTFKSIFTSTLATKKTREIALFGGEKVEQNFIYNQTLKSGSSGQSFDKNRLKKYITIFENEAIRYLLEQYDEIEKNEKEIPTTMPQTLPESLEATPLVSDFPSERKTR